MKGLRKFYFGIVLGGAYLLVSWEVAHSAIAFGRDLTATGVMIGAIATGVVGVVSAFVWGNAKEQP